MISMSVFLAALVPILFIIGGIGLLCSVLYIVCYWKIFNKAGERGWAAIVPFYSQYVLYTITWGAGWYLLVPMGASVILGAIAPMLQNNSVPAMILSAVTCLAVMVFNVLTQIKLAKAFGKPASWALGLVLIEIVFLPILAFGSAEYSCAPGYTFKDPNMVD
ncbi:MAG: DUF5684 domain-containing protein [Clostridia bacterium]